LGATALEPSAVVLGAMGFAVRSLEEDVALLRACVGEGLRAIDTAPLYGFGSSERAVGRLLAELPANERPEVYTKVGLRWEDARGDVLFVAQVDGRELVVRRDSRPESVIRDVETSCERLGLERLALVQVHHRDPHVPIAETMGALADLHRAGRVGAIGVSNFSPEDVAEAARALGSIPLASLQSSLSLLELGARASLHAAQAVGAGFLAYSPLAQGLLTGAHGPDRSYPPSDWRAGTPLFSTRSRARIAQALARVVDPIAQAHDATRGQIALAWVLHQPGVTAAIAGASSAAQAAQNVRAATIGLSTRELATLERAFAPLASRGMKPFLARASGVIERAKGWRGNGSR
jgi:aryl-alcohol dehydrogenase-like predicted oxidoreductase